jgi:hypothetical protein
MHLAAMLDARIDAAEALYVSLRGKAPAAKPGAPRPQLAGLARISQISAQRICRVASVSGDEPRIVIRKAVKPRRG